MGLTVIIDGPSAIPSSTYVLDRPKHAWRLPETTIYSMLSAMDHPEYFLFYPGWPSHEKVLEVYLILVFFRSNSNGYFLVFLVFTLQWSSFWVCCFLLKWKLSLIYNHTLVSFSSPRCSGLPLHFSMPTCFCVTHGCYSSGGKDPTISHKSLGRNVDGHTYKAHTLADKQAAFRVAEENAELALTA